MLFFFVAIKWVLFENKLFKTKTLSLKSYKSEGKNASRQSMNDDIAYYQFFLVYFIDYTWQSPSYEKCYGHAEFY